VYGVYKIIMTLIVLLIMGRNKPIDPVSNFFRFTLRYDTFFLANERWFGWTLAQNQVELITHNVCFSIIGILIISNIRSFGLTFLKFSGIFFKSVISQYISVEFTLLMCSQIIGVRIFLIVLTN
jgi:hypothetical protein